MVVTHLRKSFAIKQSNIPESGDYLPSCMLVSWYFPLKTNWLNQELTNVWSTHPSGQPISCKRTGCYQPSVKSWPHDSQVSLQLDLPRAVSTRVTISANSDGTGVFSDAAGRCLMNPWVPLQDQIQREQPFAIVQGGITTNIWGSTLGHDDFVSHSEKSPICVEVPLFVFPLLS